MHSIKCNSVISSLSWRKTKLTSTAFGDHELISTHGEPDYEVKLWQINKHKRKVNSHKELCINGKKVEYWFTKIKDFYCHQDQIIDGVISPDSSTLATLGADETLRFWRMFESFNDLKSKRPIQQFIGGTKIIGSSSNTIRWLIFNRKK